MTDFAQDERLKKIAQRFKNDMQKLGLGVTIQAGDAPPVKICDPPEDKLGAKDAERS